MHGAATGGPETQITSRALEEKIPPASSFSSQACPFAANTPLKPGMFERLLAVTSRTVVWLFVEQLRFEFVPVLHRLQGRLAA